MNLVDRPIPFRPEPAAIRSANQKSVARVLAAFAIARARNESVTRIVERTWPNDTQAAMLTRAAVTPLRTTDAPVLTPSTAGAFLLGLAAKSAATLLFALALQLDLTGKSEILIPRASTVPLPIFVAEGGAMPIGSGVLEFATVGPTRKMLIGTALTEETELYASPDSAAEVIGQILATQAGPRLDAVVFDNVAADTVRPAGLLADVTPIGASAETVKLDAMVEDLQGLVGAIADAGGSADRTVFIANARQAMSIKVLAGSKFDHAIFSSAGLAAGTVVAVDPNAIASAYSGIPIVETSKHAAAHFEDTNPLMIGTAGTPPTVAAPVISAFQQGIMLLKVRVNCAWAPLAPGAIQVVNSVIW